MLGVATILVVMLTTNYFIGNNRVNDAAEKAFADKLRQITGMAGQTRAWVGSHQEKFRRVNEQGERDINTVPVVVAWQVAQEYAASHNFAFKTPALNPRNPDNTPDDFERTALNAFLNNPDLKEYHARQSIDGKEYFRFAVPVRIEETCLECHGFPVGEKDAFGFAKEGMKVGDLRAAFSVSAPATELVANESANAKFGIVSALLIIVFVAGGIFLMTRKIISRPLAEVSEKMVRISEGDIDQSIEYNSSDEIGVVAKSLRSLIDYVRNIAQAATSIAANDLTTHVEPISQKDVLGHSFKGMVGNLTGMVRQLSENTSQLVSAATEVASSAEQMARGSKDQTDQVTQVSTAVEEMTAAIMESAKNAQEARNSAERSGTTAGQGAQIVSDTIQGMQAIGSVVRESAESITKLACSADQIGEIVSVIDDIADQTNLLALNAAIEAARAGEQGRGFAVVADEVRKLAERTGKATGEITEMIKGIQSETSDAVQSMERGVQEVDNGRKLADKAGTSLNEIVSMSQQVQDIIQQIASASDEQSSAAEMISKNMESVSSIAKESASGAEQSAAAAEQLSRNAEGLREMVARFKTVETANTG